MNAETEWRTWTDERPTRAATERATMVAALKEIRDAGNGYQLALATLERVCNIADRALREVGETDK